MAEMSPKRAKDFFDSEAELSNTIDKAERNARGNTEELFVDDIAAAVGRYGLQTFMSERQYTWLKQIAER